MSERRLPPVLTPPIAFADGGARIQETPDSLAAFELADRLGATGVHTSVWSSLDGLAVVHGTGSVSSSRLRRRRPIVDHPVDALPYDVPTLARLIDALSPTMALSLHIGDVAAIGPVADLILGRDEHAGGLAERVWIAHHDVATLAEWRQVWPSLRLVVVGRLADLPVGPERHAADLAAAGIDAVRLPYEDWSGGLATLFHRFEVLAFAGPVDHERMLDELLRMGVDAVASPHVDRMVDAFARAGW